MKSWCLLALVVALLAFSSCQEASTLYDFDGDGSLDEHDCGTSDPEIYPGAPDSWGNGASWVHNIQAGYLLYHVYFRGNKRWLPFLGVLAEAAGDTGAVLQEYVLKHDVSYGHYAHAEGLAIGLAAGWLLDQLFTKKMSAL